MFQGATPKSFLLRGTSRVERGDYSQRGVAEGRRFNGTEAKRGGEASSRPIGIER